MIDTNVPRLALCLGAILAGCGVALGAFGAHGLEGRLEALGRENLATRLQWFETGVRYQLYHALAILAVAGAMPAHWRLTTGCFTAGIVLFSGSLYAIALGPPAWTKLGMVTPLGGLAFLIGWTAAAINAWRGP